MRSRRLIILLIIWQVGSLQISLVGYGVHLFSTTPSPSKSDSQLAESLLNPSQEDLRKSVSEVEALAIAEPPPHRTAQEWEHTLAEALEARDTKTVQRTLGKNQVFVTADQFNRIQARLAEVIRRPDDVDAEIALAQATLRVSRDIDPWLWRLWHKSPTPAQKASSASILAWSYPEDQNAPLLRAALRFASVAPAFPRSDLARITLNMADHLASSENQWMSALLLYQHAEHLSADSKTFGLAVSNQAFVLDKAGYRTAARQAAIRVIHSDVNDKDPGGSLMETNRNYHHRAALLIADSYRSQCAFPWAYWWRRQAAEKYKYHSWCGTCTDSANFDLSISMLADSALAGPFAFVAHMILFWDRTWFLWFVIILATGVAKLVGFLRRRFTGGSLVSETA